MESVVWADEIVVVDNTSTDNTAKIAKKMGAKVFSEPNRQMLNINKNYGFEKATSEWILCLDADEEVSGALASEIKRTIRSVQSADGYWIARKNILFGKWIQHGLWWPDKQLRLFRKGKGKFPCRHVHEYIEVAGQSETLTEPFVHYNYETVSQFIRKMDTIYTENEVTNLKATNYQLAWYDALRFPVSDFVKIYFAQGGYRDGLHGLVLSVLQAFYSFIVFAKLWESEKFPERQVALASVRQELKRSRKEIQYWVQTTEIKESKTPLNRLLAQAKRKFGQLI